MKQIDWVGVKKVVILISLLIASTSLMLHLTSPGTTRSGFPAYIDPYSTSVQNLHLSNTVGYNFGIEIIGPEEIKTNGSSAYLLLPSQYNDYLNGTPLNETGALIGLTDGGKNSFETTLSDNLNLYLVFANEGNTTVFWEYYYYVLPISYYPTFLVAFTGAFIAIVGFTSLYTGWKRWFLAALGVQSVFFLIRVFTLSTYSLNLPAIFWDLIQIEPYNDYQYFYLSWIPRLWEGVWPYSADMVAYLYPPLWIYTVGMFGSIPSWLPGLILFTFNAATGILIYKIALKLTDDTIRSRFAMMLYMLNPFTLFYGAFMWLNPTPYVFFVTLSFYLALIEKEKLAVALMAVATLYKQFAVIFFPILVILFIKRGGNFNIKEKFFIFLKHSLIYSVIVGLVSLPFLMVSPTYFLSQVFPWNAEYYGRLIVFIPDSWMTVHANTFYLWLNFPKWFTDSIAFLLSNYVFLILSGVLVYGGFMFQKASGLDEQEKKHSLFMKAILLAFIAVLCVQLFYPRGSYKFYLLALTPFLALLFDTKDLELRSRDTFNLQSHHFFSIIVSSAVFLCYRFIYFWLLGAWAVFYLSNSDSLKGLKNQLLRASNRKEISPANLEEINSE
ncbi:MAG: hypothetical protein EAX87_06835 [Candidatus Thorarchaeota archaeon]|nr:hypothetical protein [Candidatus Thorarchaeota archaeon]